MKFNIFKTSLIFILSFFVFTTTFAASYDAKIQRQFIIKVTSTIPGKSIPVKGTYMIVNKNGTDVYSITQNTPIEIHENALFFGNIFYSIPGILSKMHADYIKVEYLYKDNNGEHSLMCAQGFSILAHAAAEGDSYITAG